MARPKQSERKEELVLLAANEDLINCVTVILTYSIIDIIEHVGEFDYPTNDTFQLGDNFQVILDTCKNFEPIWFLESIMDKRVNYTLKWMKTFCTNFTKTY